MEVLLNLPDCQINPAFSEQSYRLFHLALAAIRRSKEKNFIIFSDSMSSLEAISGFKLEIDIVQNIIKDYTHLANSGKTIILCWISSHVNIRGNERADTAAKSALSLPVTNMKLPACELLPCVSNFCLTKWQDIWDCCEGNKLHSIYPSVGIFKHSKICPVTSLYYSTDFELVILVSLTHTYCVAMILQPVGLAEFHLQ